MKKVLTIENLSAIITGLTPGTTYEYRVVCADFESPAKTITTEAALQLKNAGFEGGGRPYNPLKKK